MENGAGTAVGGRVGGRDTCIRTPPFLHLPLPRLAPLLFPKTPTGLTNPCVSLPLRFIIDRLSETHDQKPGMAHWEGQTPFYSHTRAKSRYGTRCPTFFFVFDSRRYFHGFAPTNNVSTLEEQINRYIQKPWSSLNGLIVRCFANSPECCCCMLFISRA